MNPQIIIIIIIIIKYLEFISVKVALYSRLINSYYFLIFTLLTANYRLLGEKVSSKGGPLIAGKKSYFFPTNVMCAVPANVEQNTKNNSL